VAIEKNEQWEKNPFPGPPLINMKHLFWLQWFPVAVRIIDRVKSLLICSTVACPPPSLAALWEIIPGLV
jgi:hypothetical protein